MQIPMYVRRDGRVGVRNHVLVLPVAYTVNTIAQKIAAAVPGAVTFSHQHGGSQQGEDLEQTRLTLHGFATHPNVFGVVVVGTGSEVISVEEIAEAAGAVHAVEIIHVRKLGGVKNSIQAGVDAVRKLLKQAETARRELVDVSHLILGTECGGSDACSGISGNPALGVVSDLLINAGGTSILAETTELIGAEHLLAARAISQEVADRVFYVIDRIEQSANKMGVDIRGAQPAPGNIEGGITTIEEKSLGCIYKGGTTPLLDVIEYAERPKTKGLVLMDTPGHDIEQLTGMVAGGAQVVIFTTGRGTPTGSPIAPVIKVATNTPMYERMKDNMDFNAGTVVTGERTVTEVGQVLYQHMLEVAAGLATKTETYGNHEFGIYRIGASL